MSQTDMQPDMQPVAERVRQYVVDNFLYMHPGYVLADEDALLGKGIIDSLGVMELISFVEDELGVAVADTDVTEQNFQSVASVARYVMSRRAAERTAA
jgi:acyl carrier protein